MRALSVIILLAALVLPSGHASASPPINISAEELQTLRTLAAQGNALAQNNLGLLYDLGDGVPQDYAVARQWYEKAAAQNHASAQFNLGLLYANGHGVPQDYAMARQWYEQAAAQGNADARGWFEKAAAQGNTNAQFYLGSLYEKGDGVPRNYAEATKWYEKAA